MKATIQKIIRIETIEHSFYDFIHISDLELSAHRFPVKKGQYKKEDLCIHLELGSGKLEHLILPIFPTLIGFVGCMESDKEVIYLGKPYDFRLVRVGDDITEYFGPKNSIESEYDLGDIINFEHKGNVLRGKIVSASVSVNNVDTTKPHICYTVACNSIGVPLIVFENNILKCQ